MKKVLTLIIGILCLSIFSIFAPQAKASLPPVGYWKFDEGSGSTAYDSSENGNTGTLMNGPQWATGAIDTALDFDGINDYVYVPSSSSLTISGNQISVELWIKSNITLDSNTLPINFLDKGNEYGFQIGQTPDGKIWFFVGLDLEGWSWEGIQTTTNGWTAHTWYHLAGTYDGSYLKIYVNGVLENSRLLSGDLCAQGGYDLSVGSYTLGNNYFFNGVMDEVRIYNYARTAKEISNDAHPSVGGILLPVDKFALLAPYIGLASTIIVTTVATSAYVKRCKHRKEK